MGIWPTHGGAPDRSPTVTRREAVRALCALTLVTALATQSGCAVAAARTAGRMAFGSKKKRRKRRRERREARRAERRERERAEAQIADGGDDGGE